MHLTDLSIQELETKDKVYKVSDGDRLYVYVHPSGQKIFRMLWREQKAQKQYTIGPFPTVTLAQARQERDRAANLIKIGVDPTDEKRQRKGITNETRTFRMVCEEWYESQTKNLDARYRRAKWRRLERYVLPLLGDRIIDTIRFKELVTVVRGVEEHDIPEITRRISQMLCEVFFFAQLMEYVEVNVSANLSRVLSKNSKEVQHRAAITDPKLIGKLLVDIDKSQDFVSVRYALKILPYVFVRSSEIRMATWDEFDFANCVWHIPAAHMKMHRDHDVPLTPRVIGYLRELREQKPHPDTDLVFPSITNPQKWISSDSLLNSLRNLGYTKDIMCIHGFRGMASTRLNEMGFRPDVIEMQLAHMQEDKVRSAYNHAIYMDERIEMMQKWSDYLDALRDECINAPYELSYD